MALMSEVEQSYSEAARLYDARLRRINQIVLGVIALLTLSAGILVWLLLDEIYRQQELETKDRLTLNLAQTEKVLSIWQIQLGRELQSIASEPTTINDTKTLLEAYHRGEDLFTHQASITMRDRFDELSKRTHHLGFFIISPDAISLSSMRNENIGSKNLIAIHRPDLLARAFAGETVLIPPIVSDVAIDGEDQILNINLPATMFIATPIYGAKDNVIAVLTERLSPTNSFSSLIALGSIAAQGHTYAYNSEGALVSFVEGQDLLSTKVPFRGTHLETQATTDSYVDFFGTQVLAAYQYFPARGIGFASEIPVETAFSTYYKTRILIVLSLLGVLIAGVIFAIGLVLANRRSNNLLQKNNRTLETINQRLEMRDEQREEMVYTLSHDLKSPLINIARFSSRMASEYKDSLDKSQRHYLNRIDKNAERMSRLIESLFLVLQVESGTSRKTWVQSKEVIQEVLEMVDESLNSAGGTATVISDLPLLYADSSMLFDCIENLISNAIKYRDPSRAPRITISAVETVSGVDISVQDNGLGIAEHQQKNVFRIFKKINLTVGHGIGLTIVKSVMEKHGGSVSLDSEPGVGSTFTLHFPNGAPPPI